MQGCDGFVPPSAERSLEFRHGWFIGLAERHRAMTISGDLVTSGALHLCKFRVTHEPHYTAAWPLAPTWLLLGYRSSSSAACLFNTQICSTNRAVRRVDWPPTRLAIEYEYRVRFSRMHEPTGSIPTLKLAREQFMARIIFFFTVTIDVKGYSTGYPRDPM